LIGVAVALVWQSQRVSTANSPNEVAVAEKHSGVTPVGQLSLQDAPPQIASATQTASTAPATSSELVQQLEALARDLGVLQRRVEELAGKQEHLAAAQQQLAAKQEQMDQTIAKPQAVKRNTNNKMSSPARGAAR
jgi:chromosome segregation ATPase